MEVILDCECDLDERLQGRSLFLCQRDNNIRTSLLKVIDNKWFERTVLLLIAVSTISLAFETPLDRANSHKLYILRRLDTSMTVCFTAEMLIKIVTFGLIFNGKHSYLLSGWNLLDFTVVVSALLSLVTGSANLGVLKALRAIRVLRPLRMIKRHKGLRVAMVALYRSLPKIINLQAIQIFTLILFGIFLKTLYGGMFYHCQYDHLRSTG